VRELFLTNAVAGGNLQNYDVSRDGKSFVLVKPLPMNDRGGSDAAQLVRQPAGALPVSVVRFERELGVGYLATVAARLTVPIAYD
jgi:hypothetical protein